MAEKSRPFHKRTKDEAKAKRDEEKLRKAEEAEVRKRQKEDAKREKELKAQEARRIKETQPGKRRKPGNTGSPDIKKRVKTTTDGYELPEAFTETMKPDLS